MKKIKTRVPSGRTVIRKVREQTARKVCASCGCLLQGIPRGVNSSTRKLAKSQLTVTRPYGGHYCAACTKELFRDRARNI